MNDKKLTICFFADADTIHTIKWAGFFANRGHSVHIISYSEFKDDNPYNIKLHVLKRKFPIRIWPINTLLNMPFSLFKARKIIKEIKPDIVHAHYLTSYGTLASLMNFHPFFLTAWGTDILVNANKNFIQKKIAKYVFNKADLITCDAEHMKKAMISLGARESKIRIINFGVDTDKFSPGEKDNELEDSLGLKGFKKIISLRSLEPVYDIESLIKAASMVLSKKEDIRFILIGDGSQKEKLKNMARDLGISSKVKFLGRIKNDELPKYIRMADAYVSTSMSDAGISASTAEAMACGLPAVITDSGENRVWVEDNKEGFITPVKDYKALADKINFVLENDSERIEMGKNARRIIEKRNSYKGEMCKMEELYKISLL